MKKIIVLVAIAAMLASCVVITKQRQVYHFNVDLRSYNAQGFVVTPFDYSQPHEGLGMLEVVIYPGTVKETARYVTDATMTYTITVPELITADTLLAQLVIKAKLLGADAITGFNSEVVYKYNTATYKYTPDFYRARGFAIKRK